MYHSLVIHRKAKRSSCSIHLLPTGLIAWTDRLNLPYSTDGRDDQIAKAIFTAALNREYTLVDVSLLLGRRSQSVGAMSTSTTAVSQSAGACKLIVPRKLVQLNLLFLFFFKVDFQYNLMQYILTPHCSSDESALKITHSLTIEYIYTEC